MSDTTLLEAFDRAGVDGAEVFYSTSRNLVLIRAPRVTGTNALGQAMLLQDGCKYEFAPHGMIEVHPGQDMLPDGPGGAEQDAIAWLSQHPRLHKRFEWHNHEEGRALPIETDFMGMVAVAVANKDFAGLDSLEAQEAATHKRRQLIENVRQARKALESVEGKAPEVWEPPEGYDRQVAIDWLKDQGVDVPDDATDKQIVELATAVPDDG